MRASRSRWIALAVGAFVLTTAAVAPAASRMDGFNVVVSAGHPFGSSSARQALASARRLGAGTVAIVPFLWQARPDAGHITRGDDMPDDHLRAAIRDARGLGLSVMVKPHVWVPESWAGAVARNALQENGALVAGWYRY